MNQSTVVALRLYIIEEIINSYWRNFVKEFNLKVSKRRVNLDDWIAKCSIVKRKIACKPEKTPSPSDFPFHKLDNVIMTPDNSAHTQESDIRRSKSILNNLLDFKKGKKPSGFVFYGNK